MAEAEDIQPLVCDNGTGMVKVYLLFIVYNYVTCLSSGPNLFENFCVLHRLDLLEMMPHELCSPALLGVPATLV